MLDVLLLPLATLVAFTVRYEGLSWFDRHLAGVLWFQALSLPVKVAIAYWAGLYRGLWRHASLHELEQFFKAGALSGAVCFAIGAIAIPGLGLAPVRIPLSVLILDMLFSGAVLTMPRIAVRVITSHLRRAHPSGARRALIAGAGAAGVLIVRELLDNPELGLQPVGFLDDDHSKRGQRLFNLPVFGALADLPRVVVTRDINDLIIAMPRAGGHVIRDLVAAAAAAGIPTRTVPGMFDIISGKVAVQALRPVEIQDLLRREPVTTSLDAARALTTGNTVLVTGAGGSIGSELGRQLVALGPQRIVLAGHGENSIFHILNELREMAPAVDFVPVIVDVRDRERLARVFDEWDPIAVFHAAAHKHVPMMECNVAEAITNNILGTRNLVEVAAQSRVEQLVFVSTDKAVRPTSVMGATKRVAEQLVQLAAQESGKNFMAVRFGNVLGSRGSVVPTFLSQIAAGGPVTVTHPEMRRYFMTIPEAVRLVLQAMALGRGGDVFVLDMGEPVKIADLAADLIRLSGKEVGTDIEIRFTGSRPGEKLYEEMFFGAEHAVPTDHPKVLRARNAELPVGVTTVVSEVILAAEEGRSDDELRCLLKRLVIDYDPHSAGTPAHGARADHTAEVPPEGAISPD